MDSHPHAARNSKKKINTLLYYICPDRLGTSSTSSRRGTCGEKRKILLGKWVWNMDIFRRWAIRPSEWRPHAIAIRQSTKSILWVLGVVKTCKMHTNPEVIWIFHLLAAASVVFVGSTRSCIHIFRTSTALLAISRPWWTTTLFSYHILLYFIQYFQ